MMVVSRQASRLDFAIIGAAKAATTWVQKQLQRDSRVFMPDPEPHFFSREFDRGVQYYSGFFEAAQAALIGEKSADYLAHPDAPRRLASFAPGARLVVQLRDPVERAYSDYKMFFRRGTLSGPPADYLCTRNTKFPRFLNDSLYGGHLERWLNHFGSDQLVIYTVEEVRNDPQAVFERVCKHIGLTRPFEKISRRRENDSRARLLPLKVREIMAPFKQAVAPFRGNYLFEAAREAIAQEVRYPPLDDELRHRLREFFAPDVERVERLLGRRLPQWKPPEPVATAPKSFFGR